MDDVEMPAEMAHGPLGGRMRTFLRHVREGRRDLSNEDLTATWSEEFPGLPQLRESFLRWGDETSGFVVTRYEQAHPFAAAALLRSPDDRQWLGCVAIDDQPPYLILASAVFPSPRGVSARQATASDGPVMREIERRTPIITGTTRLSYDRGDDYLAGERLMGDVEMFVMERDGRVVGLGGRAFPPVRVAGVVYRGLYSHRLRLLPEAQGGGVQGPMNALRLLSGAARHSLSYAFVAEGNEAAIRSTPSRSADAFWAVGASRLIIDTANVAGPTAGRPADASDIHHLVGLFNFAHQQEELFVPYTADSLSTRLLRATDLYSWHNIIMGEDAALGIWPAGLGVHRESDGVVTNDERALVLDYGCKLGAERELISLIRASCGVLARRGTSELSIFSSPPSDTFLPLSSLAKRIEPYMVSCAATAGPGLQQRGVYIDQLYF
jgi:hypothetical protein